MMATCKNCIHYAVCGFDDDEIEYTALCSFFKDRSRFVELPCKVGDTVYIYAPDLIYNPSIVEKAKVLLIQIHSKDDIRIFLCDEHCDKFWITLDTFIKGVKFNKEEAEQALK